MAAQDKSCSECDVDPVAKNLERRIDGMMNGDGVVEGQNLKKGGPGVMARVNSEA